MGVASLVLGIIGLLLSFIPVIGILGAGLAVVGLILGIVDWVQKKKAEEKYGKAVAGVVCSAIALVIVILYTALAGVFFTKVAENVDQNSVMEWVNSIQELDVDENGEFNFSFDLNSLDE